MKESKTLTTLEFFALVKVVRMIYDVQTARYLFENSCEEFIGYTQDDFKKLLRKPEL